MKNKKFLNKLILLLGLIFILGGCSDSFLETNPTQTVREDVVYSTYESALSLLDGTYRYMHTYNTSVEQMVDMMILVKNLLI